MAVDEFELTTVADDAVVLHLGEDTFRHDGLRPDTAYEFHGITAHTLPRPGGGRYHININSQAIRADRDYPTGKPAGVRRIIVLGDSMTAGQFLSNADRFSELLERRDPSIEVINLALEGSGTDQQVLLYEHVGLQFEHDLVVLLPFLQNTRRNMVEARDAFDPRSGRMILRPKPRFEFAAGWAF